MFVQPWLILPQHWGHDSLEIGAGGGLVGLAVAKGCVVNPHQPLYMTDQLEMLSLMQHNVVLNQVEGRVKPLVLNWCVFPLPASAQRAVLKAYIPSLSPVIGNGQRKRNISLVYEG